MRLLVLVLLLCAVVAQAFPRNARASRPQANFQGFKASELDQSAQESTHPPTDLPIPYYHPEDASVLKDAAFQRRSIADAQPTDQIKFVQLVPNVKVIAMICMVCTFAVALVRACQASLS